MAIDKLGDILIAMKTSELFDVDMTAPLESAKTL